MHSRFLLLAFLLLPFTTTTAVELTGRYAMFGVTALAQQGDSGYTSANRILAADQHSLRLMLDNTGNHHAWSIHVKTRRLQLEHVALDTHRAAELFRLDPLANEWLKQDTNTTTSRLGYETDRLSWQYYFNHADITLGRQALDWGSGRFWQPFNIFGSFAATELDTDYKAGIDAIRINGYPSNFSSISAVYAFAAPDIAIAGQQANAALYYRRQIGEQSELSLLAGNVITYQVAGVAMESSWGGMGWRIEATHTRSPQGRASLYWIAGVDYQFSGSTTLTAEWYDNSRGAQDIPALLAQDIRNDPLLKYKLQPHLARHLIGLNLATTLTPLLNARYTLLLSPMNNNRGETEISMLQQLDIVYSISNEADLLIAALFANGRGLNSAGQPQSEFGHLPTSLSLRLRFYF